MKSPELYTGCTGVINRTRCLIRRARICKSYVSNFETILGLIQVLSPSFIINFAIFPSDQSPTVLIVKWLFDPTQPAIYPDTFKSDPFDAFP